MTKAELRTKYKHLRMQLSPNEAEKLSEKIIERALSKFQIEGKIVSIFLPIERQKEINTYHLLERAKNIGAKVVLPKSNFETLEIKHYLYENDQQLSINEKGIPEPKQGKIVATDKIDFVFVPLLAVDELGNRVGYGKGFYDRFLKKCSKTCKFIGLHYFHVEEKISDVSETDIRLDFVVLPEEIIQF